MEIYSVDNGNEQIVCIGKFYIPDSILNDQCTELMYTNFETVYDEIEFIKNYNYYGDRFKEYYLMIIVRTFNRKCITPMFTLNYFQRYVDGEDIFITNNIEKLIKDRTIKDLSPEKILQRLPKSIMSQYDIKTRTGKLRLILLWCLLRKPYI